MVMFLKYRQNILENRFADYWPWNGGGGCQPRSPSWSLFSFNSFNVGIVWAQKLRLSSYECACFTIFFVQFFAILTLDCKQKNSTSHIVHSPFSWLIFTWAWYSQQSYSGNGITDSTNLSSFHFSSFQSWVKWSRLEFLMKKDPLNLYWWLFWNNARVLFLTNCSTSSSHV